MFTLTNYQLSTLQTIIFIYIILKLKYIIRSIQLILEYSQVLNILKFYARHNILINLNNIRNI